MSLQKAIGTTFYKFELARSKLQTTIEDDKSDCFVMKLKGDIA